MLKDYRVFTAFYKKPITVLGNVTCHMA